MHKNQRHPHPPPAAHPPATFRKIALTAISLSLLTPTFSAFAQYKYKAYVKDLLTNGTTIVVPPQDQTGQLIITPTSFDFPNTPKDSTAEAVFTAKNTATDQASLITLGAPSLSNPSAFTYSATCPAILAPQAACEIRVQFNPTAAATYTTSLSFPSANAASPLPVSTITGQGIPSAISFSANPLAFPDTDVTTTSAPQTIIINNLTSTSLTVTSISTTAPYAIQSHTCGERIAALSSCTALITFSPSTIGTATTTFTLNTIDKAYSTTLTGKGVGPTLDATPSAITSTTSIDLTPSASAFTPLSVITSADPNLNYKKVAPLTTLTNSGTKPLNNLSISYTASTTATPYISHACPTTLAVGASCVITASAYRHQKNQFSGYLTISGTSIPPKQVPVAINVSPVTTTNTVVSDTTAYDFGSVVVHQPSASKHITFSYFGDSTATLSTPANPPLSIANNTCTNTTLSPGDTCSLDLTVTPLSPSTSAHLNWNPTYKLESNPATIQIPHSLTYSGLGETLTLSPPFLNFGNTTTSSSSSTSYTLSNTGNRASALTFSHSASNPSFNVSTSACSTLQPGTSCPLVAVGSATTEGIHTGVLIIQGTTSSISAPSTITVSNAPILSLSSKFLNFGSIAHSATISPQTIQVANLGASNALLGTLTTTAPFSLTHNCPSALPPASACTLTFGVDSSVTPPSLSSNLLETFVLAAGQPYTASITLTGLLLSTKVNSLSDMSLTPSSATFPYTPVGQQSIPKTFIVYNGDVFPHDLAFQPIGSDSSQFTLTSNACPSPIPANGSCAISVAYAPTTPSLTVPQYTKIAGLSDGELAIAADLLASDIPVNSLVFNPLNFNPSNPPTGSNLQNYYYKNTSANPLTITPQFQIGTHFLSYENTCSSVPSNTLCRITVQAKTDTEGSFQDSMNVNGTIVSLSSTVYPFAALSFSQNGTPITSLNYGVVSHKKPITTASVQLNNTSATVAELKPINFSSTAGTTQTNDCPPTLTNAAPCNFQINITPTTIATPLNVDSYDWASTLNVYTKDGYAMASLPIKGTSVVGTHSLPTSIDFGTIYMGHTLTKPLTITNTSPNQAEISVTSLSTGATDLAHTTPCLNTWFSPGQTCTSTLSFAPTTPGARTGTVSLGIIGKTSQPRTVSWTANVLTGFTTEGVLSPTSWAPSTLVGTPITQTVTFTNTYDLPITVSTPTFSSGFPAPLTVIANACSGRAIQPQATCDMTLQFSSPAAYEKTTPTTLSLALSTVNQSVSFTVTSAYASLGDPTITALQTPGYPANYAYTGVNSVVAITGTGFATGSAGTKIFVNGTEITTSPAGTGPYAGWKIVYSSGATASTLISLLVPKSTPTLGNLTITAHNIGSANDATALLHVVDTPGVLTPTMTAFSTTHNIPVDTSGALYATYPNPGEFFTSILTFTNSGGLPYTFPGVPTSTPATNYAVITADSCAGLTTLEPAQSCNISFQANALAAQGSVYFTQHAGFYSSGIKKTIAYVGSYSSAITSVSVPALSNGYQAQTISTSLLDFGTLLTTTPRTATVTVKNTSTYSAASLIPSISGNSAFTITAQTCTTSNPIPAGAAPASTCTITLSANSPSAQGPISATLDIASDLSPTVSLPIYANSTEPVQSAGVDLTNIAAYFPFTGAPTTAVYPTTTTLSGPPSTLTFNYQTSTGGNGASYQAATTPFHSAIPSHSTTQFTYSGSFGKAGFVSSTSALLSGTGDFTISAWVQDIGEITSQSTGTTPPSGARGTYSFYVDGAHHLCFKNGDTSTFTNGQTMCTTALIGDSTTVGATKVWSHAAVVRSGPTLTLYVNGVPTSFTLSRTVDFALSYKSTLGFASNVGIADLALFTRPLTSTEINKLYTSHAPLIAK